MNLDLFVQTTFLFVFCLILAALETQIEGAAGWAANLPTHRPDNSKWIPRLYGKIMGGRELTLYHVFVFTLVVIFMHYPYFAGKAWSLGSELTTLSLFFLIIVVWDFLWFVINPKYDFGRFWGKHVLWHKKWFLHMPTDYWFAFAFSAILYSRFSFKWVLIKEWFEIFSLFLILTSAVILFAIATGLFKIKEEFKR